jgi:hypothetical protein
MNQNAETHIPVTISATDWATGTHPYFFLAAYPNVLFRVNRNLICV